MIQRPKYTFAASGQSNLEIEKRFNTKLLFHANDFAYELFCIQVSIDKKFLCDLVINCDNAEDEMNCTEDDRFYCESGTPLFVRRNQVRPIY